MMKTKLHLVVAFSFVILLIACAITAEVAFWVIKDGDLFAALIILECILGFQAICRFKKLPAICVAEEAEDAE